LRDDAKRQKIYCNARWSRLATLSARTAQPVTGEKCRGRSDARHPGACAACDIDAQLAEMQVIAPADSVLEVLSVKWAMCCQPIAKSRHCFSQIICGAVYVPEPWLGLIKVGDLVRVRVDSFPGKDFEGTVEQINRQARIHARATCKQ